MVRGRILIELIVVFGAWIVSTTGCATARRVEDESAAPVLPSSLRLISLADSLIPLIDRFNAEREKPRFVAILSSTCGACIAGGVSVKEALLEAFGNTDIGISIIWIDILPSDNEASASRASAIFDDPRVAQFHDPRRLAGQAFAAGLLNRPPAWDIYLFYEPGSTWTDGPPKPAQWMHQLGFGAADEARSRTGDALAAGLYQGMVELGFEPATDSPPTHRQLAAAKRRANATIANARRAQTPGAEAGGGQCDRCASLGTISQCSLAGWRYVVAVKPKLAGGDRMMTIRTTGNAMRPETVDWLEPSAGVVVLDVAGMTCPDCPLNVAFSILGSIKEVQRVEVDFDARQTRVVVGAPGTVNDERLIAAIRQAGYDAKVVKAN